MNPKIQQLMEDGVESLPREKMLRHGVAYLSNAELLAILLRSGSRKENVLELSKHILSDCKGDLIQLSHRQLEEFLSYEGVGETKAMTIMAALELGRRRRSCEVLRQKFIGNSNDVYEYIQDCLTDLDHEEFWVIMLKVNNEIIGKFQVSIGGTASALVDVKLLMKKLVVKGASAFVICHNHPSEKLDPSEQDRMITRQISKAADLLDIKLLDHLIVGSHTYFSFMDQGLI